MARRANGEGTIYQRKDGRYEAATYALTTAGTRKRVRLYGKTRAEVQRLLVQAKSLEHQGVPTPAKHWRIDEYLEYWLREVVQTGKRPTTYQHYSWVVSKFISPNLGPRRLDRLRVARTTIAGGYWETS